MSTTYWYSTNGMDHKRLADRHVTALDEAFGKQTRVQIYDDEAFGNMPAIASPHLGTMTSGDIHYGLYRQPSLWQASEGSMDSLILMTTQTNDDMTMNTATQPAATGSSIPIMSQHPKIRSDQNEPLDYRHQGGSTILRKRQQQLRDTLDGFCCLIS